MSASAAGARARRRRASSNAPSAKSDRADPEPGAGRGVRHPHEPASSPPVGFPDAVPPPAELPPFPLSPPAPPVPVPAPAPPEPDGGVGSPWMVRLAQSTSGAPERGGCARLTVPRWVGSVSSVSRLVSLHTPALGEGVNAESEPS